MAPCRPSFPQFPRPPIERERWPRGFRYYAKWRHRVPAPPCPGARFEAVRRGPCRAALVLWWPAGVSSPRRSSANTPLPPAGRAGRERRGRSARINSTRLPPAASRPPTHGERGHSATYRWRERSLSHLQMERDVTQPPGDGERERERERERGHSAT